MRMHGHAAHDDMKYVPAEQIEQWKRRDPIDRQVRRLEALGVDVAAVREEVAATIAAGVEEALAMPMPDPAHRDRARLRRRAGAARGRPRRRGAGWRRLMTTMTYLQAISDAHARGDARRRARLRDGRGHRRLRRRLQGHRRLHRGVRRRPRDGHAAGRVGDRRLRGRRRRRGHAADLRDAVRRLHLVRLRPARQRRRQDVLPAGPEREHHGPAAQRRRLLRRPVPLPEPRGVVHARARA